MALPDPDDHTPDCPAIESGQPPAMIVSFSPSRGAGTIMVRFWERCESCGAQTSYEQGRMPYRRFHREWRATLAVWLATWEHRHQIEDRVTGT